MRADARWVSQHWWSGSFELMSGDDQVASVRIKGSHGTAEIGGCQYVLERFRLPPCITIRDADSDELAVRCCLIPQRGGLLAEFRDGESFHLGWVRWWKREWVWTDDAGEPVLSFRRPWFENRRDLNIEPAADRETWPLLAVLEIAGKLAIPWF